MSDKHSMPGRPRSFDETVALTAAMDAFWDRGFEATTYSDLETATGLRRQSLVYAFGDKRSLFDRVLHHYARQRVGAVVAMLEAEGSPLGNIRAVFQTWLDDAANTEHPGCLLVNTAGEFGRKDPDIAQAVGKASDRLAVAFEAAFRRAQAKGELAASHEPADLARLAVSVGDGALLNARASGAVQPAVQAFRALIDLLH